MQATALVARLLRLATLAALFSFGAFGRGQCSPTGSSSAGAALGDCPRPPEQAAAPAAETPEEDDLSLLSLTTQVRTRSHRKEHAVAKAPSQDHALPPAREEYETDEAEEVPLRGRAGEEPSAEEEAPRRRQSRHKRPMQAAEPPATAEEEPAPDEVFEEPGAAWAGAEVQARTRHGKALPPPQTSALQEPMGRSKALSDGVVEAPIAQLVIGVVVLAGVGAFLLHEVSEFARRGRSSQTAEKAVVVTPHVQTSPPVDSAFLFHVLNKVEARRDKGSGTATLLSKGPPVKHEEDSSDDCSNCPRPEKEPESECDDCEDALGKLRDADWALQIAYFEAIQRRNENPRHQAHGRSSRRSSALERAEALVESLKQRRSDES